ncbi:MAG: YidC/Oxa1 family membrane protein insertase [Lachnospiraceae bacterium]|nr:YidC/Oxa1 family membrane protein insertase [Lachnospiraceae bacterium]
MVFLTQVDGILGPIAWVLGKILNAIYNFISLFGIENIALCIVIFTFVVKMLMLPLTIKQQKFTKLQSKMSPELTKIQQKYKGKNDEESLRRQRAETQEVYAKYGASPMGGCLPLLISLPIMFALYRVIYAIPAYVTDIGELYGSIADKIKTAPEFISVYKDSIVEYMKANALTITQPSGCSSKIIDISQFVDVPRENLIDLFSKFNKDNWNTFLNVQTINYTVVNDAKEEIQMVYQNIFCEKGLAGMQVVANGASMTVSEVRDKIISVNSLFGLNILDRPELKSISVVIPALAVITQYIQGKLQTAINSNKKQSDDPAQQTSKMMSTIMPIMSGVFCLMLPIGVGVYWIASAVFTIIQTLFINKYLEKVSVDDMVEQNKEKNIKRQEKLGVTYNNKMAEVAKTKGANYVNNTKDTYDNTGYKKNSKQMPKKPGTDYQRSNVSYSAGSIAANANLLARNNAPKKEVPAVVDNSAKAENDDQRKDEQ